MEKLEEFMQSKYEELKKSCNISEKTFLAAQIKPDNMKALGLIAKPQATKEVKVNIQNWKEKLLKGEIKHTDLYF